MPIHLNDWVSQIVKHNMSRPNIRIERFRPLQSLFKSIEIFNSIGSPAIIAEYKRKSPSGFNSNTPLRDYINTIRWCAAGVSILTEELYFGGSYINLVTAASMLDLPILMKDFIVCEKQLETAYNIGADVVLLIATILTEKELEKLYEFSKRLRLEVVIEVHDENDLEKALALEPSIIGINARSLKTLEVSLENAARVLEKVPKRCIRIVESGIKSSRDIQMFMKKGANAFLIGTTLMRDPLSLFEFANAYRYSA
jgi:indole-3-glycerol phosphate synthase